jgi:hypothetical protein
MIGTGDMRVYTGSGIQRVIPYVQFELPAFLLQTGCERVSRPKYLRVCDLCSLKAYMCCECVNP